MATTTNFEQTEVLILRAIRAEVERVVEAEAEAAAERVREAVRGRINEVAVRLMDNFSMERMGRDLVIRVNHEGLK